MEISNLNQIKEIREEVSKNIVSTWDKIKKYKVIRSKKPPFIKFNEWAVKIELFKIIRNTS